MPSSPESRVPSPIFALVAGEDSGDQLGADLIEALRARFPDARFMGVGGPRMRASGFDAWHDIAELAVIGVTEVLRHLPRLLRLRNSLTRRLIELRPDVFIGIDAPDFNLGLEKKLHRAGIRTVHYVSPSLWAWRERRAEKIGQCANRVLCLFPMEPAIYARHSVNAQFVGHPLADRFPINPDRAAARRELGLDPGAPVLAVLPGSRLSEIRRLGAVFLEAAQRVAEEIPGLQIVIPAANTACRDELETILHHTGPRSSPSPLRGEGWGEGLPGLETRFSPSPLRGEGRGEGQCSSSPESRVPSPVIINGQAHRAMIAADVVLLASGTAALEAMLAKRPMVVGYRISPATHALIKGLGLMKTNVYSLPNILAGKRLVPELMQGNCTAEKLGDAVTQWFHDPDRRDTLEREFERMHLTLHAGGGAAATAARAVEQVLESRTMPGHAT